MSEDRYERIRNFTRSLYGDSDIIINPREKLFVKKKNGKKNEVRFDHFSVKFIIDEFERIGWKELYTNEEKKIKYYSDKLEKASIPYFNFLFYSLVYETGKIPTLDDMYNEYVRRYCQRSNNDNTILRIRPRYVSFEAEPFTFTESELKGRIYRLIGSFYQELYETFKLSEEYDDWEVLYRFSYDIMSVDILIKYNGKIYGLASYTESGSNRGDAYRKIKVEYRHGGNSFDVFNLKTILRNKNNISYNGIEVISDVGIKEIHRIIKYDCIGKIS